MSYIACYYCNDRVPPDDYDTHLKREHPTTTVPDMCRAKINYDLFRAVYHHRQEMSEQIHGSGIDPSSISSMLLVCHVYDGVGADQRTRWVTADDVAAFRVNRSNEPGMTAQSLRESIKHDTLEFVKGFQGLGKRARERCINLARKLPVFACLGAHVFTHLVLCAGDHSLLNSFISVTQEWIKQPAEWCLINHLSIKTELLAFLKLTQVRHHRCYQQRLDDPRIHYLDIHSLAALVLMYSTEQSHMQIFYDASDEQTQAILDLLQELIDLKSDRLGGSHKRRFLDAIVRLCRKPQLYPRSLKIDGVDQVFTTCDRGDFGTVFYGVLSGRIVALKELQPTGRTAEDYLKEFCREAVVWRNVHHRNCLPFYGVTTFTDDGISRACTVSPWMPNNLKDYLSLNPDILRLPLLFDIASGLDYLHAMHPTVVHGDLRTTNISVTTSGRACLSDFGLAIAHDTPVSVSTIFHSPHETAKYTAPELILAQDYPNGAAFLALLDRRRCDMFALGCVAYEIWTGEPPITNDSALRTLLLLCGSRPARPTELRVCALGLDQDVWMWIMSLWAHHPEARLVASSARDFLRFKMSLMRHGVSGWSDDGEWDTGFLSSTSVDERGTL